MIARIRRGNDFHVAWQIKRGGVAENLENVTDIKLERTIYGVTTEHTLFTVSGDTITAEIPAEVQTHYGQYKLTLSYELVDTGMSDDDRKCKVAIYAFAIVDPLGPADDLLTVDVASDVSIGFKGDEGLSAYQVWLENGNVGTEDDYFDYLRQPATDAAASVSELEQTVSGNEALRVTAEQGRVDAELLRVGAESARSDAEGLRDSAEDDRILAEGIRNTNETGRINAESDRVDAEVLREQAEVAREEAEGLRQTNTTTAIQNAGEATTAANTAAGLANSAATTANTAAGNANDAATAANTAAGLADTARTELTTAVNTKLGEADGKISEMNTTLSTYDGRVTQVESDITQLAGDMSLLDKISILQRGQILSNSIRQYVPFSVKQNDVVHLVTSNVDLVITDPLTQYYSVSLAKDESITNLQSIVRNEVVEKDVYIVANSDCEYVYLYVNPNTGVVSYDVKLNVIPFEKLKDWILSEAYTVSDMTYDSFGNVKIAQLTYPDATGGAIQTSTSDAEGRLLTMIFTYGSPTIIRLQMTITYSGDLVDTITINKI